MYSGYNPAGMPGTDINFPTPDFDHTDALGDASRDEKATEVD